MYKPSICSGKKFTKYSQRSFKKAVGQLKVGDGFGDGTTVGPLIDENAVSKVQEHIEDAIQKGGTVLYGGQKGCRARRILYATNCNWIGE